MHNSSSLDKVIICDLELQMSIGIHDHERENKQRVIINLVLDVASNSNALLEDISEVVSYEDVVNQVDILAKERHYNLVERFAEDIAELCFNVDDKVQAVDVRAEKPDIIENIAA
ncbi:MAG: dihydroneopterin aldolase, partial [Alphaproteobacteria bacterium]|nr:dihydroneopterin aldolase [Alphaproteobacteria bacterium]